MTVKLTRGLLLWAGALALSLLAILPLAIVPRIALTATVFGLIAYVWSRAGRRSAQLRKSFNLTEIGSLPSTFYRQPVVLVCGGGQSGLFGETADRRQMVRLTEHGCYVRVPDVERLPHTVASLLAMRPDWKSQLSVMFVVNPAEHDDHAVLADHVGALAYQLRLVRKQAIALPLLMVSYLKATLDEEVWFSWEEGQTLAAVRHACGYVSAVDWQQRQVDGDARAQRLQAIIQIKSVAGWLSSAVSPHLVSGKGRHRVETPVAWAISLVSALPEIVANNLWQQWRREKTALIGANPSPPSVLNLLPFPDPSLALLPRHSGDTVVRRACVAALWMSAVFGVIALANSAWQNTLLLRQVNDDLLRYASSASAANRDPSAFEKREHALNVLQQDVQRLDDYYRHGEPLALGLGLYRGENLRGRLWDAIASYRAPVPEKSARPVQPMRLDSLSLFNTGSAELKPGSSKVLINALVGIKTQPGWLVVVTGHTDATGSPEQNLQLSWARAAAVRGWMQRMGDLPDSCFAVQGFGASQPIASNGTEQGRAANRRVDIRLVPEERACALLPIAPNRQSPSPHATLEN